MGKRESQTFAYFVTSCAIPKRGSCQSSTFIFYIRRTRLLPKCAATSTERAFEQVRLILGGSLKRTKVTHERGFWWLLDKKRKYTKSIEITLIESLSLGLYCHSISHGYITYNLLKPCGIIFTTTMEHWRFIWEFEKLLWSRVLNFPDMPIPQQTSVFS